MINKFSRRFNNIPHEIWQTITEIETLRGQWGGNKSMHPIILDRLRKSVLVTSTGASTRIEGSSLSDPEIEELLNNINIEMIGNRDQQEVRGYYELLGNVFNSYNSLIFSESLIQHFHKELLKYTDKDILHRGHYKKQENAVGIVRGGKTQLIFPTTRAYLTPKEMNELVEWTSNNLISKPVHPLLIIGNFIVEFLLIHPFVDGNGRLSRILTNLLLLKTGYDFMPYVSHEKLIEDSKPEYYLSLRHTQKTLRTTRPDLIPWLKYFLNILLEQAKQANQLFTKQNLEMLMSPRQQNVWSFFQSHGTTTPLELSQTLNIPRPTINQILNKLLTLKLIERSGAGRATHYRKM